MKKFEITKEQIKWLDQQKYISCMVRQWFPDAFKNELEVEKWYKCNYTDRLITGNKSLIFISEISGKNIDGYGFDFNGIWFDKKRDCGTITEQYQEATPQEVEAALICEAKKIGYENQCTNSQANYCYSYEGNYMYYNGIKIFDNGIWATIIQPEKMTLSQIEKELGRKIEIV